MRIRWLSFILLLSIVLAGCAPSKAESVSSSRQNAASEELSPTSTENPPSLNNTLTPQETPSDPAIEHLVSLVKKNLAERLHIDTNSITLVKAVEVTWPDAALGCPSPGKVYAEVETPGYKIQLKADNKEYSYHTDRAEQFILCSVPNRDQAPSEIPVQPGEIDDDTPWMPVN